jgi:hypothetical protein
METSVNGGVVQKRTTKLRAVNKRGDTLSITVKTTSKRGSVYSNRVNDATRSHNKLVHLTIIDVFAGAGFNAHEVKVRK